MKYEFHAHFPFALQDSVTQAAAIDFLAHKRGHPPQAWPELAQVEDGWVRMALLSQTLVTNYKDQSRVGARNDPGGYAFWLRRAAGEFLARQQRWLDALNLAQSGHSLPDLTLLPAGSFAIHFTFTLTSPYISKDDAALHLLDNPVRKEWVFKLPYIASTQWKGGLRAAVRQINDWDNQNRALLRLFGEANDDKPDEGKSGRLYFYPTFFDRLGLEVINPHDRKTGAGSQPILMECVPAGTTGVFTLLYTPLDRIGQDEAETRGGIFADLLLVAQGLEAMFTLYGFGAKTSSGFGLADNAVREGTVVVGGLLYESEPASAEAASPAPAQPDLPRYLAAPDRLHPDFVSAAGDLKSEAEYQKLIEGRGQIYAKRDKQLYGKAKSWWEREGQQLASQPAPEPEAAPAPESPPAYPLGRETFDTLNDLPAKANKLSDALHQMGGDA